MTTNTDPDTDGVEPFTITMSDDQFADLRDRLARTRYAEAETVPDASQGMPRARLEQLVQAWGAHDWRRTEHRLNALPQHRTVIDGMAIHFLHVRSPHPQATPLLMTHGWPGSFLEFEPVIDRLTDPPAYGGSADDAVHLIIPSLPGFGFSPPPARRDWGVPDVARAWLTLMTRLGYDRFAAHGGDWGAFVSTACALAAPERVSGLHLTLVATAPTEEDLRSLSEEEQTLVERRTRQEQEGYGYALEMGTRPQTVGVGLVDSPAALAAWLGEKFDAYADPRTGGVPEGALLDQLSLYWFTATGTSSSRFYWYASRSVPMTADQANADPVRVPTCVTQFPADPYPASRRWAERRYLDLRSWREPARGGHFPALEDPELFTAEVQHALRSATAAVAR